MLELFERVEKMHNYLGFEIKIIVIFRPQNDLESLLTSLAIKLSRSFYCGKMFALDTVTNEPR